MKLRGVWVGIAAAMCGLALTALLAFALPLALVGAVTALVALGVGRPEVVVAIWLAAVCVAGAIWNTLQYFILFGHEAWGLLVPLTHPTGVDFLGGLYEPGRAFSNVTSSWPPLTIVVGRAFNLVGFESGRLIQIAILIALAAISATLSGRLALNVAPCPRDPECGDPPSATQLSLIMSFWLLTSYGFLFEVERGNIDLYVLVLSLFFVWTLLRLPRFVWLPCAILTAAINLKVYPAALLPLLFWRFGWRALLPMAVCGGALLFVAGPANVWNFLDALRGIGLHHGDFLEWDNHSAASYAHVLHDRYHWLPAWLEIPLLLVPIALWAATIVVVIRRGCSERGAVLVAAACVILMPIVPTISNNYSLVLVTFPLAALVVAVATTRDRGSVLWSILFGVVGMELFFLARSSRLNHLPSLTGSKYTLLLLLQVTFLVIILVSEGPANSRKTAEQVRDTQTTFREPRHDAGR